MYDSLSFKKNSEKGKDTHCLTKQNWMGRADWAWQIFKSTCRFLWLHFLLGVWFLYCLDFLNSKMLKFKNLPKKSFGIYWSLVKRVSIKLLACEQSLRNYIYAVYGKKRMVETILRCSFLFVENAGGGGGQLTCF